MKPRLNGNWAELYAARATKVRKTKNFHGVEYVIKIDTRTYWDGRPNPAGRVFYEIGCAGINAHGVRIAAYFEPGRDSAYFWQYADTAAVNDIMETPEHAYNWDCVKNGIQKTN